MGLLNKIFRQDPAGPASVSPAGSRFQDSDAPTTDSDSGSNEANRTAVRKELVQVTLRETMRRHAVPSDWLDVRMLPVVSRKGKSGMHVQLVVKQGQGSLLGYIPAFQSSFMGEIEKFDARAWEWLLSISWQFTSISSTDSGEAPNTAAWGSAAARAAPVAEEAQPPADATDSEIQEDLQALFAIRDAALQQPPPPSAAGDFEPTRPGESR